MSAGHPTRSTTAEPGHQSVWISLRFVADERQRAYHWSSDCLRAPAPGSLLELPLTAVVSSPRLVACPLCKPRV